MQSCERVTQPSIRWHYDLATVFYRLFWGPHIHHGYWEADESPRQAQVQLTERLADAAGVDTADELLDVGCGMGGSSIHLAKTRGCRAVGITISPLQQRWARCAARLQGVGGRTRFECADAESIQFADESFDVVWSVECTEHLFDKPQFFQRAAGWLRPGGTMAICAWLEGEQNNDSAKRELVEEVCEGFLCPSLGTATDYCQWMRQAGLEIDDSFDWTTRVRRTWKLCQQRVERVGLPRLARFVDRDTARFLNRFESIDRAFSNGAMKYGAFIARRPSAG